MVLPLGEHYLFKTGQMTNESTVIERTHTRSPIHSFLGHGRPDRAPRPKRRGTELGAIFYLPRPLTRKARGGGISGRAAAPRWHVLCRPRLAAARSAPLRPSAAAGDAPVPPDRRRPREPRRRRRPRRAPGRRHASMRVAVAPPDRPGACIAGRAQAGRQGPR